MQSLYGFAAGLVAGGALSYLFAAQVIAEYKKAAGEVGVSFAKVAGKLQAAKKAL